MKTRKKTKIKEETQEADNSVRVLSFEDLERTAPEKKASLTEFAQWARVLLQNWRQGTVACKGRSDVAFSNKKPWKQKGTGRARAGSARSPLWRKGGVTFGPQARVRTLKISQKSKKNVCMSLLDDFVKRDKVLAFDWKLTSTVPKTAEVAALLKSKGLNQHKVTLFLPHDDMLTYASAANIPNVRVIFFDQPNLFDLAASDYWVVFKKDMQQFNDMVLKWS